ncbi:hypothetical protein [Cellulophaga lytica]|uniref:hypothetical protein n=2 Tax=Flavobacteriaceae TaxID=49546 RepID=UPI000B5CFC6B|nr:hypothetical protein [Cellulophaga lytica]SNQ45045.1 conserved hypothetical protein [Cellulophaga lytica]
MKRILIGIGTFLFIAILVLRCDIPMTKNTVEGVYANTNYGNEICCLESPHKADTLILKSDRTFTSGYYGNGTYKVNYGILTTEIDWTYEYEFGKAGHSTYFSNKIYEKPKIILNYDLNHYYEKVE